MFGLIQSDGEAASTRALAGSILSRNERDRDSGLGTPQPGQMEVRLMEKILHCSQLERMFIHKTMFIYSCSLSVMYYKY